MVSGCYWLLSLSSFVVKVLNVLKVFKVLRVLTDFRDFRELSKILLHAGIKQGLHLAQRLLDKNLLLLNGFYLG